MKWCAFSSLRILLLEFARSYDYPMQSFYGQARHTSLRPAPTRAQICFFQMHLMLDCYFFTVYTFCVFLGSFVFFLWSFLVCVSIWFSRVVPCFSVAPYGAAFVLLIVLLCGSLWFFCLTPYGPFSCFLLSFCFVTFGPYGSSVWPLAVLLCNSVCFFILSLITPALCEVSDCLGLVPMIPKRSLRTIRNH